MSSSSSSSLSLVDPAKKKKADEHIIQGDKYTTTSLFRWSPDWDSAVVEFTQAASMYKGLKLNKDAANALSKLANAQMQTKQPFSAGKSLQDAGILLLKINKKAAAVMYFKASKCYEEAQQSQKTAECLKEAGTLMVDLEYESAVNMLTNAIDIAETENLPDCPNIQQALINAHLQYDKFGEAFSILQRQIDFYAKNKQDHYVLRAIFYGTIVLLRRDDLVRARGFVEKQSESNNEFSASDEWSMCQNLLTFYEERDPDSLREMLNQKGHLIRENCYVVLFQRIIETVTQSADVGSMTELL